MCAHRLLCLCVVEMIFYYTGLDNVCYFIDNIRINQIILFLNK